MFRFVNISQRVFSSAIHLWKTDRLQLMRSIRYGQLHNRLKSVALPTFLMSQPITLLVIARSFNFTGKTSGNPLQSVVNKAEELYAAGEHDNIYELLLPYKDSKNDEVLWRLSRATFEKSQACSDESKQKLYIDEAYLYISTALEINANNFAVQKWMAILLDKYSTNRGTKERIKQTYNVKHHMEKAIELNPKDSTTMHLLGYWCYSVADIPWYQQKLASAIFATPPSSNFSEALEYFLKAEMTSPGFYSMNLLMLGKTYLKLGDKMNAAKYLQQAADYPVKNAEDEQAKNDALALLSKL